ncbi:MAG: DUF2059 domain-containing protein [Phenylobacterium sp.]|uniref:DUF2059 domain-containing protein n=1 Tax=Phenylobacterium sp. TaxID=1871053 RepID=UPI003BB7BFBD
MRLIKQILFVAGAACLTLSSPVFAESGKGAATSARSLELAERFVTATGLDKIMEQSLEAPLPQLLARQEDLTPELTTEEHQLLRQAVLDAVHDAQEQLAAIIRTRASVIVADSFSEGELPEIVTFYESPAGQSLFADASGKNRSRETEVAEVDAFFERPAGREVLAKLPSIAAKTKLAAREELPPILAGLSERLCAAYPAACPGETWKKQIPPKGP